MRGRGVGLRALCREVGLDPSFFSKVLAGKRSPPSEEDVLRRIAEALGLDAAELVVSAGRIPREWRALWKDPDLFRDIHARAQGLPLPAVPRPAPRVPARLDGVAVGRGAGGVRPAAGGLSEELL